jgi:hypothetical protein
MARGWPARSMGFNTGTETLFLHDFVIGAPADCATMSRHTQGRKAE